MPQVSNSFDMVQASDRSSASFASVQHSVSRDSHSIAISSIGENSAAASMMSGVNQRYQSMDIKISLLALDGVVEELQKVKKNNELKTASCMPKTTNGLKEIPSGKPPFHPSGNSIMSVESSTYASSDVSLYNRVPITAVATFTTKVHSSAMSTNLPSLPLGTPISYFGNLNRHVVSWPADFDPTGTELSTFKVSKFMKKELLSVGKIPGEDTNSVMSIFVPEKLEIGIGLMRGSEMIAIGAATLVVTGEELIDTQVNLPVKTSKDAVKKHRRSGSKLFRKSPSTKALKALSFPSAPTRKYKLDESATLRLLVKVTPGCEAVYNSSSQTIVSVKSSCDPVDQVCDTMNQSYISEHRRNTENIPDQVSKPMNNSSFNSDNIFMPESPVFSPQQKYMSHIEDDAVEVCSENRLSAANEYRSKPPPVLTTPSHTESYKYQNSVEKTGKKSNKTSDYDAYPIRIDSPSEISKISQEQYLTPVNEKKISTKHKRSSSKKRLEENRQQSSDRDEPQDIRQQPSYDSLLGELEEYTDDDDYTYADTYVNSGDEYYEDNSTCAGDGTSYTGSIGDDTLSSDSDASYYNRKETRRNVRRARKMIHNYANRIGVNPNELI